MSRCPGGVRCRGVLGRFDAQRYSAEGHQAQGRSGRTDGLTHEQFQCAPIRCVLIQRAPTARPNSSVTRIPTGNSVKRVPAGISVTRVLTDDSVTRESSNAHRLSNAYELSDAPTVRTAGRRPRIRASPPTIPHDVIQEKESRLEESHHEEDRHADGRRRTAAHHQMARCVVGRAQRQARSRTYCPSGWSTSGALQHLAQHSIGCCV